MIGAPWIGLSLVGTWFLATMVAGSVLVWLTTPWILARGRSWAPAQRADALLVWRLLPAAVAVWVAGLLVAPTFLRHEEPGSTESVPAWMALLAALAVLTLVVRTAAGLRAVAATRAHLRRTVPCGALVRATADGIVESPSGTAMVAGLLRPRILVSRALASSLTSQEFEAVLAHERAHIGARDNLKRLAMVAAPDWLGWTQRARGIERAWAQATELAADDAVAARGPRAAIDLAAALVKAARLRASIPVRLELSSGMFDGDEIATRVTRLALRDTQSDRSSPASTTACGPRVVRRGVIPALSIAAALAAALLMQFTPASRTLHEVSEWAVGSGDK
jgi:hypothetical protein